MNQQANLEVSQSDSLKTRKVSYKFKAIPASHKDFSKVAEALKVAGIPHLEEVVAVDGQNQVVAIRREAVSIDLPVWNVTDFPADFIQSKVDLLVMEAAKKKYIDRFLPVDLASFTPAEVVAILESGSDSGSGLSKELVAEVSKLIKTVLLANSAPAGVVDILCGMIEAKFSTKTIKANAAAESQIPQMFGTIGRIYSAQSAELQAAHLPVLEACNANYQKYLAEKAAIGALEFSFC